MDSPRIVSNTTKPGNQNGQIAIGCLIYPRMDQIDFTGPFEVLSRMSDTTVTAVGRELAPIRDVQGLRLTPDVRIAEAGTFDVLVVPGGTGSRPSCWLAGLR